MDYEKLFPFALLVQELFGRPSPPPQLRCLARHFPPGPAGRPGDWLLDPRFYEMALLEFIKTDPEGLLEMVRAWNPDLYNQEAVVKALMEELLISPDQVG